MPGGSAETGRTGVLTRIQVPMILILDAADPPSFLFTVMPLSTREFWGYADAGI
jgi:hypothetical protein